MNAGEILQKCHWVVQDAGYSPEDINLSNFLDYSDFVRDIVVEWPREKQGNFEWFPDFVRSLRKLRDNFDREVERDPPILYTPAHAAATEFHQSTALVRYFRAPNRSSKTQSGVQDNYWVVTQSHPYRPKSPWPVRVGIIGINFSKYAPGTFETKYLGGEGGNPLSPVFPENGKWFYKYDSRKYIIYLACPQCAAQGTAQSCKHPKGSVTLFSDREGPSVIQGQQCAQFQFDEQISEEFFSETMERLKTVPHSGLIVTETPLNGKGFWTHKVLTRHAEGGTKVPGTDQLLVSLHTTDQFTAGLTPHERIRASMEMMSAVEIEARIYGRPAAFHEHGVFDSIQISEMSAHAVPPGSRGILLLPEERGVDSRTGSPISPQDPRSALMQISRGTQVTFVPGELEALRVWAPPEEGAQYVIGVDVAQGLTGRDASCASVLKMEHIPYDLKFSLVAQLHGWINPRTLAEDITRLSLWYNEGLLVVERNGPGTETLRSLKEWGYWSVFRDERDPAEVDFAQDNLLGVTTDPRSKSVMLSALQQSIWNKKTRTRTIEIPCADTIDELGSFGQELTPSQLSVRFRGAKGMPDDRVMSLLMAVYSAKLFSVFDFVSDQKKQQENIERKHNLSQKDRELWAQYREEQRNAGDEYL